MTRGRALGGGVLLAALAGVAIASLGRTPAKEDAEAPPPLRSDRADRAVRSDRGAPADLGAAAMVPGPGDEGGDSGPTAPRHPEVDASKEGGQAIDPAFLDDAALELLAGRWDALEEARESIAAAGPRAAIELLDAARTWREPSRRLAAILLVEDFLDGDQRDPSVVDRAAAVLPAAGRDAFLDPALVSLRPLALRVLGHIPDPATEEFLIAVLDDPATGRAADVSGLATDALGRAGAERATSFLQARFERSADVETRRTALLALSRIAGLRGDERLATEVAGAGLDELIRSTGDEVEASDHAEWFYVTLGMIANRPPGEVIATRILPGRFPSAAKEAALRWLEAAGTPEDAEFLARAADSISEPAIARRASEVASRLLERAVPR